MKIVTMINLRFRPIYLAPNVRLYAHVSQRYVHDKCNDIYVNPSLSIHCIYVYCTSINAISISVRHIQCNLHFL